MMSKCPYSYSNIFIHSFIHLQISFRHSVSQSPVTRKSSPAMGKRRRRTTKSSRPRFPQAPPYPVQGPPTACRRRTAWPRSTTRWMAPTPHPGAPPTGAWLKSAGSSRHCKVSSLPQKCGGACLLNGSGVKWWVCSLIWCVYRVCLALLSKQRLRGAGQPVSLPGDRRTGPDAAQRRSSHIHHEH